MYKFALIYSVSTSLILAHSSDFVLFVEVAQHKSVIFNIVDIRLEWLAAQQECWTWGGNMTSIHSQEEMNFLEPYLYVAICIH